MDVPGIRRSIWGNVLYTRRSQEVMYAPGSSSVSLVAPGIPILIQDTSRIYRRFYNFLEYSRTVYEDLGGFNKLH
jgi:hypothetical protein